MENDWEQKLLKMSFTGIKDSDNYATDKIGWEIINKFIPKDKQIWCPF